FQVQWMVRRSVVTTRRYTAALMPVRTTTAAKSAGMSRLLYASHICRPRPDEAPIHSATTAPIRESGAATFSAANRNGRADGQRTWRKYWPSGASIERNQSATAGSTDRKPSTALINTGKNVR